MALPADCSQRLKPSRPGFYVRRVLSILVVREAGKTRAALRKIINAQLMQVSGSTASTLPVGASSSILQTSPASHFAFPQRGQVFLGACFFIHASTRDR